MDSRTYWKLREEAQLKRYIAEEAEYQKHIGGIYDYMMDQIQKEINGFYTKYAKKEGITLSEAKKRVSKLDIEEYGRKAAKYVKEKDFSKEANEEMRLYNATMKINRLEMLKANIGLELVDGFSELQKYYDEILTDRTLEEFERQAGILGGTVLNNAQAAHAIVNASFHNAKYSDRIWMYQDMLKAELDKLLRQGLIQGKHPRELARHLSKLFGVSKGNAERLMRTELARVQVEAQMQSFGRNGYEEYEFIALGAGACGICKELDGKHFKVKDRMPGENAPPMHPNCRCSTAAYVDEKEYEEWLGNKERSRVVDKIRVEDVTQEYLNKAKPEKGTILYEAGYDKNMHKEEIAAAHWIYKNLGGNIKLLEEAKGYKILTPDYQWNEKLWDLKTVTTEKSANSAIRHGLKQIQENPGGIILNYENRNVSLDVLQEIITKRMTASAKQAVDIMIVQNDKVLQVLRYKK